MSDFFSRLAERVLGTGPAVRPLIASRFQDESGGDGFTEDTAEREISAPAGSVGSAAARTSAGASLAVAGAPGASTEPAGGTAASGAAFTPPALTPAAGPVLQRYASGAASSPITAPVPGDVAASAGTAGRSAGMSSSSVDGGAAGGPGNDVSSDAIGGWPSGSASDDDSPLVELTGTRGATTRGSADGGEGGFGEVHAEIDGAPAAGSQRRASESPAAWASRPAGGDAAGTAGAAGSSGSGASGRRDSLHPVARTSAESVDAESISSPGSIRGGVARGPADAGDAGFREVRAEVDVAPDAGPRRAPSASSAAPAGAREGGDPAGITGAASSSTQPDASGRRESIHPVVRAAGELAAADASSPWGESVREVEGDSVSSRQIARGGLPSSEARGSARSPSTEDAGESSARADHSGATLRSSPHSADDGDGEWLVPGGQGRAHQPGDVAARPETGFDVIDDEVEDGVTRSARSMTGERAESERARRESRVQTTTSASPVHVDAGSGRGSRSVREAAAPGAEAASITKAAAVAADAVRMDAREAARVVEVSARRASAAARDEALADAQARGRAASVDDADSGASRGGEGQGTAIVPRQRSVSVTASVASTQSSMQPQSQPQTQARPALPRAEAERPVVHVTIGRIEVRAVTPPAPAPEPRPAPGWTPPVLSLDEYLKRGGNA